MTAAAPRPMASCRSARLQRRRARQQPHDRAGDQQRDADEHRRRHDRGGAAQAEQVGQHRDQRARGEEQEARDRAPTAGADRLVVVGATGSASVGAERGRPPALAQPRARRARSRPARPCRARGRRARARWRRRRGRAAPRGRRGSGADASSSSRCERTETNSPAPIDSAPASSPAMPVNSTTERRDAGRADAEHEREVGHQAVVRAEHRRPERAGEPSAPARGEPAHHLVVDALVGRHRGGGVGVGRVRRPRLGALGEREHEDRAEPPGEAAEHPGAEVGTGSLESSSPRSASQCASWRPSASARASRISRSSPVTPGRELAVDRGLGALVGEVPPPSRAVGRGPVRLHVVHLPCSSARGGGGGPGSRAPSRQAAFATVSHDIGRGPAGRRIGRDWQDFGAPKHGASVPVQDCD